MAEFKLGRLRFVWKGVWSSGQTYVKDDIIRYSGKTYVCVSGNTAAQDFYADVNYGKWELMTDGTAWKQNPWTEETQYAIGDMVRYGGRVYICVEGHTSTDQTGRFDIDFDAPNNYWNLFVDGTQWQDQPWTENYRYKTHDIVRYGGRTYICVNDHTSTASTGRFDTDFDAGNWQLYTDGTQWVGDWTTSYRYKTGDIVAYGGKTYISVNDHTSDSSASGGFYTDLNANQWDLYADGTQWKYLWNPSTYYKVGDIVKYNGWVYICKTGHTSAATTTDGLEVDLAKWDIYAENIKYRGEWQPVGAYVTRYVINDVVKFGASTYICVTAHESGASFDETKWTYFVEGLQFEDSWSALVEYQHGDVVTYGGYAYVASRRNTNKVPPAQVADWELLTTGFKFKGDYNEALAYKIGELVRYGGNSYVAIAEVATGNTPTLSPGLWELLTESFAWRADWTDATDYRVGDTVVWAGTTYRCIADHTSAEPDTPDLDANGDFWNVVAAGAEGNKLSRRGDILTRNATQNIRLPRGLDGQILKVSGNDLEWKYFGEFPRVYYVATTGQDLPSYGTNWETPWRTIKYAMEQIADLNNGQELQSTVFVKTGLYTETFPIVVPRGTSIVGDELRTAIIEPTPATSHLDKFLVQNWTTIRNFTFRGATGTLSAPNQYGTRRPTGGAWVSLDPGTGPTDETVWITTKSPYVQNVSTFGTGCVGMKVDGSLHNGGLKTMVYNDFTQVLSDGIGAWITNQARAELVSVFSYYGHIGYLAENGGLIRATNGNSSYGTYGCVAEGVDPTEVSRIATVDNQRLEAQIGAVFTNGQGIMSLEYDNAGQNYTLDGTTYTFAGSGNNNIVVSAVNTYNGGVTSVRLLSGGADYKAAGNNAQGGDNTYIRLSASDAQVTDGYVGERLVIIDGAGVGQYGWIYAFDGGSKIAKIAKESDNTPGWDTFWTGHAIETVLDSTSRYSIEPRPVLRTGNKFTSSAKTLPASRDWSDVAYGNGKFVAVASGASATGISANGYIWEEPASGLPTSTTWTSVEFAAGLDRFATIASGGTAAAYSANNGASWSAATLPASGTWASIAWGATASTTYTNLAGTNLTGSGIGATFNVTRSAGVYTVAVNQPGTGYAGYNTLKILGTSLGGLTPDNDLTITITSTTSGGVVAAIPTNSAAIYGRFVAIATSSATAASSVDGATWTSRTMPSGSAWTSVCWGGTKFVAVASGSASAAYSEDGITWTSATLPSSGTWADVAYGNGRYIAIRTGSTEAAVSTDGITWSALTMPNANNWSRITYAYGLFWAIASGTDVAATSIDGTTWDTRTLSASAAWKSIVAGVNPVEDVLVAIANGPSTTATTITPPAVATATISKGVSSIGIDDVGGGYTTPPSVHFAGDGTASGGSGAAGTVTISGGLASIVIKSAGTGYTTTPDIEITGGGGNGAAAHATITDTVYEVELLTSGTGFTSTPSVQVGGPGTNAIISAKITNVVNELIIGQAGGGYHTPPTVTFSGGGGSGAVAHTIITGTVTDIQITEGGSGYDPLNTVVVISPAAGDSPSQTATAHATFDQFGTVTDIIIDTAGAGYTKPPIVALAPLVGQLIGSSFNADAIITGSVTSLVVDEGGQGYETAPDVQLSAPDIAGAGNQATCTANITGSVISLTVVDGGQGYTSNPTLTITGGNGVNATAQVVSRTKKILEIVVDSAGSGYTSNPAVSILGGGGVGAIARARISGTVQNVAITQPGKKYDSGVPDVYFSGGNNYKSINAGLSYYQNASSLVAIGDAQRVETLAGIEHLKTIAQQIVNNDAVTSYQTAYSQYQLGGAAPAGTQASVAIWCDAILATIKNGTGNVDAAQILLNNREFIRAEVIAYIDATYPSPGFTYNKTLCSRDVGLIVDALAQDLIDGGVYRTVAAGTSYYRNASAQIARGSQLVETLAGIEHIKTLAQDILNNQIVTPLQIVVTQVFSGTLSAESGTASAAGNNIDLIKAIVNNSIGSTTYTTAVNLLTSNKTFIKAEIIAYINSTYADFEYNQVLCARDVGYIVDALVHDCIHATDYTALATATTSNIVDEIAVVYGGQRYSSSATVGFSGGGGSAATATTIRNSAGTITGFTITNHGTGYSSAPAVTVTPDTGSGAVVRTLTLGAVEQNVRVVQPGSGYSAAPHLGLIDANNTADATFEVKIANGVLGQPSYSNRGTGYLTATATVSSNVGYADIAQSGSFVYVRGLTNVPTPGANVTIEGDDTFYKLVTVREIVGPTGIVSARNLIVANKEFIQAEVIAYIDGFTYDTVKCSRDVGLIIDALAYDQVFNSNFQSIKAAQSYYRAQAADVKGLQRFQTVGAMELVITEALAAIEAAHPGTSNYAKARVSAFGADMIDLIKNGLEWTPATVIPSGGYDANYDNAKDLLLSNKAFIKAEIIAWIQAQIAASAAGFSGLVYSQAACARDVGYIVDALAYDLTYTGNSQSVDAGLQYYFNSNLVIDSNDKTATLGAMGRLSTIVQQIVVNTTVSTSAGNTETQVKNLSAPGNAASASELNVLAGYITTIINSGAGSAPSIVNPNTSGMNIEFTNAKAAMLAAKATIQTDTITYVNNNFVNFSDYNKELCSRDVGLIIDAITTDIYGDTAACHEAGLRYFANASSAIAIGAQKYQTLAGIEYINTLMQDVITNTLINRQQNYLLQYRDPVGQAGGADASTQIATSIGYITEIITNGDHLADTKQILLDNKAFIQAEVIAYINATYENFNYNQELCSRDVGYIIDAMCYDIYGGLARSQEAALRYYTNASSTIAITTQLTETVAAIDYITTLAQNVLANTNPPSLYQDVEVRVPTSNVNVAYDNQQVTQDKVAECIAEITSVISNGIDSLPEGKYTARLQLSPQVSVAGAPAHGANITIRSKYSQVRLTGHDFLNVGTGNFADTNYPGIPVNIPDQANEIIENGGGRCFYTSTDQDGNFRVGELFRVEQATGIATLNADAFNLAGLNELSLGGITLGGTNATIREFSTDSTLSANSDNIVPTQKAIKTYIAAQLGSGGGILNVNAVIAGDTQISQNIINTSGSLSLELSAIGGIDISQAITSTSTSTGSLRVVGGVGVQGDIWAQTLHTTGLADVAGNFTASGSNATVTLSPSGTGTVTIAPTGGLTIGPTATGNINNVNIGVSQRGTGGFTSLAASSTVTFSAGADASSTTTGTLQVSGGVGITQALFVPTASFTGTANIQLPSGTTGQRPVSGVAGMFRYNSDTKAIEYYNGTTWLGNGGFANVDVTTNYAAKIQEFLFINTTSGAVTVTLPAAASQGDMIRFLDVPGTFRTNNLTIANNGLNIYGVAQSITVNTNNAGFTLVYTGASYGWKMLNL